MAIIGLAGQPVALAQRQTTAEERPAFDVASVRQSKPGTFTPPSFPLDAGDAYASTGGRFSADFPLATYIAFAYKLSLTQEQRQSMLARLPKWAAADRFDIQARAEGNPTKDQMRLMMQSLLADRFKLALHFETRDVPVLALTLVKSGKMGPKLRPHSEGPPCDASAPSPEHGASAGANDVFPPRCDLYMLESKPNHMNQAGSRNTTMNLLAASLPSLAALGRPVVDQTGLTGRFDFAIEWTPESNSPQLPNADGQTDSQGPTFLEAVREQLGLKLEATRAPIRTLIIDRVERPSEN
jgi:bla regulator protein blaR1